MIKIAVDYTKWFSSVSTTAQCTFFVWIYVLLQIKKKCSQEYHTRSKLFVFIFHWKRNSHGHLIWVSFDLFHFWFILQGHSLIILFFILFRIKWTAPARRHNRIWLIFVWKHNSHAACTLHTTNYTLHNAHVQKKIYSFCNEFNMCEKILLHRLFGMLFALKWWCLMFTHFKRQSQNSKRLVVVCAYNLIIIDIYFVFFFLYLLMFRTWCV